MRGAYVAYGIRGAARTLTWRRDGDLVEDDGRVRRRGVPAGAADDETPQPSPGWRNRAL